MAYHLIYLLYSFLLFQFMDLVTDHSLIHFKYLFVLIDDFVQILLMILDDDFELLSILMLWLSTLIWFFDWYIRHLLNVKLTIIFYLTWLLDITVDFIFIYVIGTLHTMVVAFMSIELTTWIWILDLTISLNLLH